jgi:serine/threonine protein kinase
MRDKVFISYSHQDQKDFDEFEKHFSPAKLQHLFTVWSDKQIEHGTKWEPEIRKALNEARVGLLLVSANFLASRFIQEVELREILQAAEASELKLFWVPLSAAMFDRVGLKQWEAAPGCTPDHPLNSLSEHERQKAIVAVCSAIYDCMGTLPSLTTGDRDDLKDRVKNAIGDGYAGLVELAAGSSSICYKAYDTAVGRDVVVKALVGSRLRPDDNDDLRERARIAKRLTERAYIRLHEDFIKTDPYCIVTEYVDGYSLDQLPRDGSGVVAPGRVREILLDLACALAEAHEHNVLHEGLIPSNVHIDRKTLRPRISAFRFLTVGPSTGLWGTFLVNRESCTYLSPEQFQGCPRTQATDQYALGLIGYELLSGKPLPPVRWPADFVDRPTLFAELEQNGAWIQRAPDLAGVIVRMLQVDPRLRWASMAQAAKELADVVVESPLDAARHQVRMSYRGFQARDQVAQLYQRFYRALFDEVPEVKQWFRGHDDSGMTRQYNALNQALKVLLDFDPTLQSGADEIAAIAAYHQRYGLEHRHLDAFERALFSALRGTGASVATLEAWRTVLAPGFLHVRRALCGAEPLQPPAAVAASLLGDDAMLRD